MVVLILAAVCSEFEPSMFARGIVETSRTFPSPGWLLGIAGDVAEAAAISLLSQDFPVVAVFGVSLEARACWESHFARAVSSTGQLSWAVEFSVFAGIG